MNGHDYKGHGRTLAFVVLGIAVGGIAILWSWNTLAVELFHQPEMAWRHAIAAVLLILTTGALLGLAGRTRRKGEN